MMAKIDKQSMIKPGTIVYFIALCVLAIPSLLETIIVVRDNLSNYGQPGHCTTEGSSIGYQPVTDVKQDVLLLAAALVVILLIIGLLKFKSKTYKAFVLVAAIVPGIASLYIAAGMITGGIGCLSF
jgi:hypothetical protein